MRKKLLEESGRSKYQADVEGRRGPGGRIVKRRRDPEQDEHADQVPDQLIEKKSGGKVAFWK